MTALISKTVKASSISYIEFWDRVNYYGLQSLLILYLTKHFGLLDKQGYALYGTYTALSFGFSILGGMLADKILGFYYATLLGGLFIVAANLILAIPTLHATYFGLAVMVLGIGLLKPNNPNLLGSLYKEDSLERTRAFSIFYLYINVGSILGPVFYGIALAYHQYWIGFIFSAVGIISALGLLYFLKSSLPIHKPSLVAWGKVLILCFVCILSAYYLLFNAKAFGWFLGAITLIGLFFFARFLKTLSMEERVSTLSLINPIVSCILFFTAFLQIYSSLTLFIDRYVSKNLFGWEIPTTWFSSIESICIILIVPLLNRAWQSLNKKKLEPASKIKVNIGLLITACSFLVFSIATTTASSSVFITLSLIVIANALLAISELCIIPVTMSLTNMLAPSGYKGTLMGVFYFSLTLSGYLSSWVAKIAPANQGAEATFTHFFILISIMLFLAGILLLLLNFLLTKTRYFKPALLSRSD